MNGVGEQLVIALLGGYNTVAIQAEFLLVSLVFFWYSFGIL